MTKEQLDTAITKNIKKFTNIARTHTLGIYETDVVVSSLYMHLASRVDKITNENLESFVVKFCSQLKYWRQNRGVMLTEKVERKVTFEDDEGNTKQKNMFEAVSQMELFEDEDTTAFESYEDIQKSLFELFIREANLTIVQITQFKDFYEHNLDTYRKVVDFYRITQTTALEILRENKRLNNKFRDFVKAEYSN